MHIVLICHSYMYVNMIFFCRTFSPEQISEEEARRVFNEIGVLEEQYGNEFSGELTLMTV